MGNNSYSFTFASLHIFTSTEKSRMSNVNIVIGFLKTRIRNQQSKQHPNSQTKKIITSEFSLWMSSTSIPNHSQMFWNALTVETYTFAVGGFLVKSLQPCSVWPVALDEGLFHFSVLHHILCKSHACTNLHCTHPQAQLLMNNFIVK